MDRRSVSAPMLVIGALCALVVVSLSCQELNPVGKFVDTYPKPETFFMQYVNKRDVASGDQSLRAESQAPSSSKSQPNPITLYDAGYPIEIQLYDDHTIYYNLPTLGDGHGTWSYQDGKINLFAKLSLFNLSIDIHGLEEQGQKLGFSFVDRHGWQFLEVDVR